MRLHDNILPVEWFLYKTKKKKLSVFFIKWNGISQFITEIKNYLISNIFTLLYANIKKKRMGFKGDDIPSL